MGRGGIKGGWGSNFPVALPYASWRAVALPLSCSVRSGYSSASLSQPCAVINRKWRGLWEQGNHMILIATDMAGFSFS